jgi:hypothetical protein
VWSWLTSICRALFDALFDKLWKEAEKPDTIEDANTPKNIKSGWDKYLSDKLRDKNPDA